MDKKRKFVPKRFEEGNIIDQLGSIIMVAFMFALILAYASYGKITQERLAIDNVSKEYLYKMEEVGYLSDDDRDRLIEDMAAIGVVVNDFSANGVSTNTTQVTYGDKVTLALNVTFENPLYTTFSRNDSYIRFLGFEENLSYNIVMSSTAKW